MFGKAFKATLGALCAVFLIYVIVTIVNASMEASRRVAAFEAGAPLPGRSGVASAGSPPLRLLSGNCESREGSVIFRCSGALENTGNGPIQGLRVVVTWYDERGTPQSSDTGFADYDPLLPGQTSTWSVIGRENPALTKWSVGFSTRGGQRIAHVDARPRE